MAKSSKNEVATQSTGEMTFETEAPEWARGGQGRGSENVGAEDMVLPRLEIVQSQSPIKDENEDAREGMMFNSATADLYGNSVHIIPVFYQMEYLVWKDQDEGGGFFGSFLDKDAAEARVQELVSDGENPEHLQINDTPVHYCLRVKQNPDGSWGSEQIVISMPKSKAKVSRKWNATIQIAGGDRFSRVYKVGTFKDKNKKQQAFYNYVIQPAGFAPKPLFDEAERVYEILSKGGARADHASRADDGEATEDLRSDI